MMVEVRSFDPAEYLDDPEAMTAYLEDALSDSVPEFLEALGIVARAKGMTELAERTGVARPALYRSLRFDGHPDIATVAKVMSHLGLRLNVAAGLAPTPVAAHSKRARAKKTIATA